MTQNLEPIYSEQVQKLKDSSTVFYCPDCSSYEDMITAFDAAVLVGSTIREIHSRAENASLHFKVTGEGKLFICLCSLLGITSQTTQPLDSNLLRMKSD